MSPRRPRPLDLATIGEDNLVPTTAIRSYATPATGVTTVFILNKQNGPRRYT
jgi:hypothetical protein